LTARARAFAQTLAALTTDSHALERLATSFLAASGFDQAGEPVDGDDRGVLEPLPGLGWLGVNADLRAVAEEHCTPNQLAVMRAYADGLGMSEIARLLNMSPGNVWTNANRAGKKLLKKCGQIPATYEWNIHAGHHDGGDRIESPAMAVLCGPRSPESDPERVKNVPFFPANDRRDLYWTTLPRNPRDMSDPERTLEAEDTAPLRSVPEFYPDRGIEDVDRRRVLLTTIASRPVVTVQAVGESIGRHTARHQRRVGAWLSLDATRPRLVEKHAFPLARRSRLLPNAC